MQVTGMLHGSKLLKFVDFPTAEVLGPHASEGQIKALLDRHGSVFVKPLFKGGVGKKGKAGLLGRAKDLKSALAEKERLYFAEHRVGNASYKANGVTFEGAVPAEHEVYFSITDSTHFRAPTAKPFWTSHSRPPEVADAVQTVVTRDKGRRRGPSIPSPSRRAGAGLGPGRARRGQHRPSPRPTAARPQPPRWTSEAN